MSRCAFIVMMNSGVYGCRFFHFEEVGMSLSAARRMASIFCLLSDQLRPCRMCHAHTPFRYPDMVLPEYATARCATNTDTKSCVAGTLPSSGTPFSLQKQCHISSPAPYATRVSSSQACIIISFTCSCSALFHALAPAGSVAGRTGVHILSRSLARQCGHSTDGFGVRCWG